MNGSIIDEMKKCQDERCLVEVYYDYGDDGDFVLAMILDVSDEVYTYACFTSSGEFNGIRLDLTKTVYKLCCKSRYLDMVKELIKIYKRKLVPDKYRSLYTADITKYLITAMELDAPVSIAYNDGSKYSVTGFIESVGDKIFEIEAIDTSNAYITSTDTVKKGSIAYMCCGSDFEEKFYELKKTGFLK